MLTVDEKKELFQKITEKRKEITQLQADLNSINDKKEHWFSKKTELSKKITSLISEIKKSRNERNSLTEKVKEDKVEREKKNKDVKASVDVIKKFEKERDELLKKHKIKDPTKILSQIAQLELKIETEPMSFDKEKKIMKQIKDLKKGLADANMVSGVVEKIHELSSVIDEKKKNAQQTHKKVQNYAKQSQEKHMALIEASGEIDALKKEEEDAFKKFIDFKKEFNELNEKLKSMLTEMKDLNEKVQENKVQSKKQSERKKKEVLHKKQMSVEEKMKKGMKLTTEDLIAYQGMID